MLHSDRGAAWKLNVNRACRDLRPWNDGLLSLRLLRGSSCCQQYRQQSRCVFSELYKLPGAIGSTPLKYLMRVHAFGLSHSRHARPWQQCQFNYPQLLRYRSSYTHTRCRHVSIVARRQPHVEGGKTRRLRCAYNSSAMPRANASAVSCLSISGLSSTRMVMGTSPPYLLSDGFERKSIPAFICVWLHGHYWNPSVFYFRSGFSWGGASQKT